MIRVCIHENVNKVQLFDLQNALEIHCKSTNVQVCKKRLIGKNKFAISVLSEVVYSKVERTLPRSIKLDANCENLYVRLACFVRLDLLKSFKTPLVFILTNST